MKNLKNILVGIDYETPADNALREAARIAAWDQAKLVAAHVLDEEVLLDLQRGVEIELATIIELGEARLNARINDALGADTKFQGRFLTGHPFREISRLSAELPADLVVLGAQGGSSDDPRRLGALADRCIRKLQQNVLIVRGHQNQPFRKVAVCVDFSPTSNQAALQAIHIAQQDSAELEFIHIRHQVREIIIHPDFYTGTLPAMLPNFDEDCAAQVKGKLESFAGKLMEGVGGVNYTTKVEGHHHPRTAIIKHVNASGADLVVVGTRGHTTIRNLLLGSTAEKIIHLSRCSTLAVKPQGFQYDLA